MSQNRNKNEENISRTAVQFSVKCLIATLITPWIDMCEYAVSRAAVVL